MAFLNKYSGVGTLIIVPHGGQPCALMAHEVHKSREYGRYIVDEFGGGTEPTKTLSQSAVKELIEESAGLIVPRRSDFFARWRNVIDMPGSDPNHKQYRLHVLYLTRLDISPFATNMGKIRQKGQCKKVGWCETAKLHYIPVRDIIHMTPPSDPSRCKAVNDVTGRRVYFGPRFLALIRAGLPDLLTRTIQQGPTHDPVKYSRPSVTLELNKKPYMIGGALHRLGLVSWTLRRTRSLISDYSRMSS